MNTMVSRTGYTEKTDSIYTAAHDTEKLFRKFMESGAARAVWGKGYIAV